MAHLNQTQTNASSVAIDEQLFTEISPEQAAIVEGGLRVQLLSLRCSEASGGSDQVFATFDGVRSPGGGQTVFMRKGSFANFAEAGGSDNSVIVRLRDKSDGNLLVGSFTVSSTSRNIQTRTVSRNGSKYEVSFRASF